MTFEISVIGVLLILNAFFALSEFAIVSSNKHVLKTIAKSGNKGAKMALKLMEEDGRFLSTIQIGITLVGIFAGAYGGATIAEKLTPYFNSIALISPHGEVFSMVFVVIIITYFSVVVGELLPKQIALSNPEKMACIVAPIMNLVSKIFLPLVKMLDISSAILMKILGIAKNSNSAITEAEVKAIIDEGAQSGALDKEEHEMLQRTIKLGDRNIKSIMTHRTEVTFFDYQDDIETLKSKIKNSRHSRYPVIDSKTGEIKGVIEVKDVLESAISGKLSNIKNFIKTTVILPETVNCLRALKIFKTSSAHLIVVVDEYGAIEGIVTLSDILESIVGVVSSNYSKDEQPYIIKRSNNSWLVDGITPVEEIHLEIGVDEMIFDPEYDTIAGFIAYNLGRELKEGEFVDKFGYRFEIIDMDGHRVDKVLISQI